MNGYKLTKQLVQMVHHRQISWGGFGFGVYLVELANKSRTTEFPVNAVDISHDTGLSRTTIRGFIKELQSSGFITKSSQKSTYNITKFTINGWTKIDQPVEQKLTIENEVVGQSVGQNLTNHTIYKKENLKTNTNSSKREKTIDDFWDEFLNQDLHWHRFRDAHQIDRETLEQKHIEFKKTSVSKGATYPRIHLANSHFFNWFMSTKKYEKKSGGKYDGKSPAEWMRENGMI